MQPDTTVLTVLTPQSVQHSTMYVSALSL